MARALGLGGGLTEHCGRDALVFDEAAIHGGGEGAQACREVAADGGWEDGNLGGTGRTTQISILCFAVWVVGCDIFFQQSSELFEVWM